MDSNDLFDKIIEYDSGSSSDKENEENLNPIRQPKTTNEQFNKMTTFINEHDETKIDKATFDSLWDNLAAKLNDIGPPDHTTSEWRRIWSLHKYYNKRKRLAESDSEEPRHRVHLDDPSCSASTTVEKSPQEFTEKLDVMIANQSKISVKMDVVIANLQLMIQELQSSNQLLQEIAKKT